MSDININATGAANVGAQNRVQQNQNQIQDSDGDGWSDSLETFYKTDPFSAESHPDPKDVPRDVQYDRQLPPGAVGCNLDSGSHSNYLLHIDQLENNIVNFSQYAPYSSIISNYITQMQDHIKHIQAAITAGLKMGKQSDCYPQFFYNNPPTAETMAKEIRSAIEKSDPNNTSETYKPTNNTTRPDNADSGKKIVITSDYNPNGDGSFNPNYPTVINLGKYDNGGTSTGTRINTNITNVNVGGGNRTRLSPGSRYSGSPENTIRKGYGDEYVYERKDIIGKRRKPVKDTEEDRPEKDKEGKNRPPTKDNYRPSVPKQDKERSIFIANEKPTPRTQLVTSIEFKPLVHSSLTQPNNIERSPMSANINQNPVGVTQAGMLLEIQAQIKSITKSSIEVILNTLIEPEISTSEDANTTFNDLFEILFNAYIGSNRMLFASFERPISSVDSSGVVTKTAIRKVLEDLDNIIDFIAQTDQDTANKLSAYNLLDADGNLSRTQKYLAAVIYYFLTYIFTQKLIFVLGQGNNTQQVLIDEEGNTNTSLIQSAFESTTSSTSDPVAAVESQLGYGLTNSDYDQLLVEKGIVLADLSPSQNFLRVHRCILLAGLGIDPKNENTDLFRIGGAIETDVFEFLEGTQMAMAGSDNVPFHLLFPKEWSKGEGVFTLAPTLPHSYVFTPDDISSQLNKDLKISDGLSKGPIYELSNLKAKGIAHDEYVSQMSKIQDPNFVARLYNLSMGDKSTSQSLRRISTSADIPIAETTNTFESADLLGVQATIAKLAATYSPSGLNFAVPFFSIEENFNRGSGEDILDMVGLSFTQPHYHYTHFQGINNLDENRYGPRTSGIQSCATDLMLGEHPNQLVIGRPSTGICFDTNYPGNENLGPFITDSDANYSSISIFDTINNLPLKSSFGNIWSKSAYHGGSGNDKFTVAPFKLSSDYANELIIAEDNTFGYVKMAQNLKKYNRSIIEGSLRIFNGSAAGGPAGIGAHHTVTSPSAAAANAINPPLTFVTKKEIAENFFKDIGLILLKGAKAAKFQARTVGMNDQYAYTGLINSILINMFGMIEYKGGSFDSEDFMAKLTYTMLSSCVFRQYQFEKGEDPNDNKANGFFEAYDFENLSNISNALDASGQWSSIGDTEDILYNEGQEIPIVDTPHTFTGFHTRGLHSPPIISRLFAMYLNQFPGVVNKLKSPEGSWLNDYDSEESAYDDDNLLTQDYYPRDKGNQRQDDDEKNYKYHGGVFISIPRKDLPPRQCYVNHVDHKIKTRTTVYGEPAKKSLNAYMQDEQEIYTRRASNGHPMTGKLSQGQSLSHRDSDQVKNYPTFNLAIGPLDSAKVASCRLYGLTQNTLMSGHFACTVTGIKENAKAGEVRNKYEVANAQNTDPSSLDVSMFGVPSDYTGDFDEDGFFVSEGSLFVDVIRRYMFNHANVDLPQDGIYPTDRTSDFIRAIGETETEADAFTGGTSTNNFFGNTYQSTLANISPIGDATISLQAGQGVPGFGLGTNVITNFYAFFGMAYQVLKEIPVALDLAGGSYEGAMYADDEKDKIDKHVPRVLSPVYDAGFFEVAAYALMGHENIPDEARVRSLYSEYNIDFDFNNVGEGELADQHETIFNNVKTVRNTILSKIEENHNLFLACLKWHQAAGIKIDEVVNGDRATSVDNLMTEDVVEFLEEHKDIYTKEPSELGKCIMDDQQIVNMFAYSFRLLSSSNMYKYLPAGKEINKKSLERMVRCLSLKGKAFRGEEESMGGSEFNQSNRLIMSIGLPCGLIKTAKGLTTPNDGNIPSSLVNIVVTRVNLLNDQDVAYIPKAFKFDTRKFVLDNSVFTENIGALSNFDADYIFSMSDQQFLNHSILYDIDRHEVNENLQAEYLNGHAINTLADMESENRAKDIREVFVNHLIDYYLKMYVKVMTGIDTDEDVFISTHAASEEVKAKVLARKEKALRVGTDEELVNFFAEIFENPMRNILDQEGSGINNSNLYEFQRLVSLAKRTIFFTQEKYLHRTVIPKKFDRVFTFLVDEGDFIPISKQNIVAGQPAGMGLDQSIQALINSGYISNLEGGDMQTLEKNHLDFHNAGVVGVFDEDAHFSDESIYQYYFTVHSIDPAVDFQKYIKDNDLNETYDAEDNSGEIGGALQLFGDANAIPKPSNPSPSTSVGNRTEMSTISGTNSLNASNLALGSNAFTYDN